MLNSDVLFFFEKMPGALPLYETFAARVLAETDCGSVRVQKTQISFANSHNFAFVSLLPVRRAKDRPAAYITVTFGLDHRVDSPRIDAVSEPYPHRWTHHLLISAPEEIDDELMCWIKEAAAFSARKRAGGRGR